MENMIPDLEARYHPEEKDKENDAEKNTSGKKFNLQISRTYPVLKEFPDSGVTGESCLIEQNGLVSLLKFYRPDFIPNVDVISKAKKLTERLHDVLIQIYDYGFDDNTKRWYIIYEYAKHGSLKDLGPNIDPGSINLLLREIIERLKALHDNEILHLNLKPSNIVLRDKQPLKPVFTDFDISCVPEAGRKGKPAALKGRLPYSAPELLTGTAGREADHWSVGMIMLELITGRHPFEGLDDRSISDKVSAQGVTIPEQLAGDHKTLLRGLLTRDPEKRWGYAEVIRWLDQDADIPVHFNDASEGPGIKVPKADAVPFRFLDKKYTSIEEMIPAFVESGEAWEAARDHIRQGSISKWLLERSDEMIISKFDGIREHSAGDPDMALVLLIYTFKNDLPFIFYGKLISSETLHSYIGKSLKKEATRGEEAILTRLMNGKLLDYCREYMMLTSKEDYELINLFEAVRKTVSRQEGHNERLNTIFRMLDILATPLAYVLPSKISGNAAGNLDFIAGNIDVFITHEKYDEMIGNLIIPEEMREEVNNAISSGLPLEYLKGLERLKQGSLLTKAEIDTLEEAYILPAWLENDIFGKETAGYLDAVKLFRQMKDEGLFIKKSDFLDYLRKYFQYIAYIIYTKGVVQRIQKGETLEQRWIRLLKCDIGHTDYIRLAGFIKNNVMLSIIAYIEDIVNAMSAHTDPT
ncbi:MAG: protein kinase, partial [Nitrospirae bacterium]|nr:protein kinase [Nitrospirota bacterium]